MCRRVRKRFLLILCICGICFIFIYDYRIWLKGIIEVFIKFVLIDSGLELSVFFFKIFLVLVIVVFLYVNVLKNLILIWEVLVYKFLSEGIVVFLYVLNIIDYVVRIDKLL